MPPLPNEAGTAPQTLGEFLRAAGISRAAEPRFVADPPHRFPPDSPHLHGSVYHVAVRVFVGAADREAVLHDYSPFVDEGTLERTLARAQKRSGAVSLGALLPSRISRQLGRRASRSATNCANAVLRFRDATLPAGDTDWETFQHALQLRYRPLGAGDTLRPGDVIVIWDSSFRDPEIAFQHAAVYVGGGFFYMKPTKDDADPYALQTFDEMALFYRERFPGFRVTFHRYLPPA
jgi:hypothetical protein